MHEFFLLPRLRLLQTVDPKNPAKKMEDREEVTFTGPTDRWELQAFWWIQHRQILAADRHTEHQCGAVINIHAVPCQLPASWRIAVANWQLAPGQKCFHSWHVSCDWHLPACTCRCTACTSRPRTSPSSMLVLVRCTDTSGLAVLQPALPRGNSLGLAQNNAARLHTPGQGGCCNPSHVL